MKYLFIILLFPVTGLAQSVSVSPHSFWLWGKVYGITELSAEYKNVSLHYFHPNVKFERIIKGKYAGKSQSTFAISYRLIRLHDIVYVSPIVSTKRFPLSKGQRLNVLLEVGYTYKRFRISYTHLSNGFGIINKINPGVDSIKFTMLF